jgi:hypothetical protein
MFPYNQSPGLEIICPASTKTRTQPLLPPEEGGEGEKELKWTLEVGDRAQW